MANKEVNINNRALIFLGLVIVLAIIVVLKIVSIQFIKGNEYRKLAQNYTVKAFKVKANRGNIYAEDGSVLATSVPNYDVAIDPTVAKDDIFYANVGKLASKISQITGEQADDIKKRLIYKRKAGKQYAPLAKKLNFSTYQKVRNFPILKLGPRKGGLVVQYHTVRAYPLGDVLKRTIGFDRGKGNQAGIEGAFNQYLKGKDGIKKKQKLRYGVWKPLSDINDIDPKDGYDVRTNINLNFQDYAHSRLKKQLIDFEAEHGSVVIMDVKTGAIKAMVNLGKTKSGDYKELRNYAVFETQEPGSTFKLFSVMSLLEDGYANPNTTVDTGNGIYKIHNKKVKDAHQGGFGKITLQQVLEKSSNVGVVKMVYENYKDNPKKFVNRLYNFGIHNKVGIDIKGEGKPIVQDPKDKTWSGLSLPWMAYGYGVELTALQILTYYNGIANNGKVMRPYLVNQIEEYNKKVKEFRPKVINSSLASSKTVKEIQSMLKGVVLRGTGVEYVKNKYVSIAGKTGTAQADYWKGTKQYISSFVGYFPADNPKYSMIVVIHKPNPEIGYYGAKVAGPVFKDVAKFVYGITPETKQIVINNEVDKNDKANQILAKYKTVMPDLRGLTSKEALYILENMGLNVKMKGSGIVKEQSIQRGKHIKKNQIVSLKLS